MRLPRSRLLFALALTALPSLASAQSRIDFVSRAGGSSTVAGPISLADCQRERWTFRLVVAGTHTAAPSVLLARGDACSGPSGDASCVPVSVSPTRVTDNCAGATCWEFTISDRWLVDLDTGSCPSVAGGYTRVFAWVDGVGVASPRIRWDTLAPAPPTAVSAEFGSESEVRLSWSYPIAAASTDAGDDVVDATDATSDALDATTDATTDVVTDTPSADVPATPGYESVRRFWVLCDPVASGGLDASACSSGGFDGLDVNDDASLLRYASQCGEADGGVASTATTASLVRLSLGRTYRFAVVAEDLAGNRSAIARAASCSSAQAYTDFWETYRATGGEGTAGCSVSTLGDSGAWLSSLMLAGALVALRRVRARRR
ncbi:MAG: hypothetical protein U0326_15525 [Polyangiales bacterium]